MALPRVSTLDSLGTGHPGLFSTCRHYISRRPQFCTTERPSFSFSPLPDSALIAGQSKTSWQDQTPGPLQLVRITSRTPKNPINRAFLNNFCYTPVPQPALLLPPPAILHILALPPTRAAATPFCPGAALACRLVSYYFILPLHQPWEKNHTKPRRECLETTRPSSCLDAVSFFPLVPLLTTRQPRVESVARSWNQKRKTTTSRLEPRKTSLL